MCVAAASEHMTTSSSLDAGMVTCGHESGTYCICVLDQTAELELLITDHAGIRRSSSLILISKVVDDPVEVVLEVQHVERDAQLAGHAPGVGSVGGAAAALAPRQPAARQEGVLSSSRRIRTPFHTHAHEQADDVIALLTQQAGGNAGIHPPAHGYNDLGLHARSTSQPAGRFYIAPGSRSKSVVIVGHR